MILLRKPTGLNSETDVLLVGRGLVGSAIENELIKRGYGVLRNLPVNWADLFSAAVQFKTAIELCKKTKTEHLNIIWAAGKAGFSANESETSAELATFQNVLAVIDQYSQNGTSIKVHLISSAGGLFEGQVNVGYHSVPKPLRPYGFLKLNMESFLINLKKSISYSIYRISTVYGYINESSRMGLIASLVYNSMKKKETFIFGTFNTMRDYVWVEDISQFVADEIFERHSTNNTYTLVSCIPMSIFQMHKIVENTINRKCLIRFISNPSNINHNTYNLSIRPRNFNSSFPFINISKIYFNALKYNAFNKF
jgi:nucleoside-diphosphate-sugar epimerase